MSAVSAHYLAVSTLVGIGLGVLLGLLVAALTGRDPLTWLGRAVLEGVETLAFMVLALLPAPHPTRMRVLG